MFGNLLAVEHWKNYLTSLRLCLIICKNKTNLCDSQCPYVLNENLTYYLQLLSNPPSGAWPTDIFCCRNSGSSKPIIVKGRSPGLTSQGFGPTSIQYWMLDKEQATNFLCVFVSTLESGNENGLYLIQLL